MEHLNIKKLIQVFSQLYFSLSYLELCLEILLMDLYYFYLDYFCFKIKNKNKNQFQKKHQNNKLSPLKK